LNIFPRGFSRRGGFNLLSKLNLYGQKIIFRAGMRPDAFVDEIIYCYYHHSRRARQLVGGHEKS
jgi:hypothetical protein